MLCLGRRTGEGIVIDHQYLMVMAESCGHGVNATLYKKNSGDEGRTIRLNIQEPYFITSEIQVTFMGWKQWNRCMTNLASLGIQAPKNIPIVRCELMDREEEE